MQRHTAEKHVQKPLNQGMEFDDEMGNPIYSR